MRYHLISKDCERLRKTAKVGFCAIDQIPTGRAAMITPCWVLTPVFVILCAGLQHSRLNHDQAHLSQTRLKGNGLFDRYRLRMNQTAASRVRRYDTCPSNPISMVKTEDVASMGGVVYSCGSTTKPCSCKKRETLLYDFAGGKVQQSCCPSDSTPNSKLQCAGCSVVGNGSCMKCLGGFSKIGDECVKCTNEHKFITREGETCATFATEGWCTNGKPTPGFESKVLKIYKHYSAAESCCVCGGGFHVGTPFQYRVIRESGIGLMGEQFYAEPYPRTANSYILAEDCELARHGLTIDGNTGVVTGTPSTAEPFETQCKITARTQKVGYIDSHINKDYREFNSTLKISIKSFGYIPSDRLEAEPSSAIVFDEFTLSRSYMVRWSTVIQSMKASYSIVCQPNSFVVIDPLMGTISLSKNITLAEYNALFVTNKGRMRVNPKSTPSQSEKLMQAACHVVAKDSTNTIHMLDLKVFAYPPIPPNPYIAYSPVSSFRVTVAQPIVSKLKLGYKANFNDVSPFKSIPGQFSTNVDCISSIGVPVVYDIAKGYLTMEGLPVVTIHPITGEVSGSPHVGLRALMPASGVRSYFTVACEVYAAVPSSDSNQQVRLLKADKRLVIQVDNDFCWVDAASYMTADGWKPMLKDANGKVTSSVAICKVDSPLSIAITDRIDSHILSYMSPASCTCLHGPKQLQYTICILNLMRRDFIVVSLTIRGFNASEILLKKSRSMVGICEARWLNTVEHGWFTIVLYDFSFR
ncbi:hypothetical protein AAMO2058_001482000 [Amorphochlora amoebiformis]